MDIQTLDRVSIPVPFAKITPGAVVNPEFTRAKIWVQAAGKNRNMSYMSEENIKKMLPSLPYVPVVGHLMPKFNDDGEQIGYYFGGHDYTVDDNLKVKPLTVPFGTVIDDTFAFEDIDEYGKTVRYLTCEAFLWTGRWPELKEAVYSDDVWFNQSLEATRIQWRPLEEDSNYAEFLSWNYSALCILGKSDDPDYHTEPCFINARIEPVKFDLATNEFDQMMSEMREQLALCFDMNTHQKGGNGLTQQERDEIFEKFALTAEEIDFEITEDMSADELTEKLEAYAAAHGAEDQPEDKPEDVPAESGEAEEGENFEQQVEAKTFSMTYGEKYDALSKLCHSLGYVKRDDDEVVEEMYCYLCDFDDEFVYYSVSLWTREDYASKRMRQGYSVAEDGSAQFNGEPEEIFQKWLTAAEIQKIEDDKKQMEALTKFKMDTEKAQYDKEVADLFEEFADVSMMEGFAEIKEEAENAEEYDTSNFELRLFALRGKKVKVEKQPQSAGVTVGIDMDEKPEDDGYGGLVTRAKKRRK